MNKQRKSEVMTQVKIEKRKGRARYCSLALALSVFMSLNTLQAQPVAGELNIQIEAPSWNFQVTTTVLQEREPKLHPSENDLAEQLRPLLNAGDYAGVIRVMESASESGLEFSPALNQILGQVYMAENDKLKATQVFTKAITQFPDFARAHQRLGLIYLQEKNYTKAREHLSKTVTLGIADAQTYGQLAYVNLQDYSPWSAIQGYQQALLLEPGNLQWQQGLLFALINARHFPAAQALVDEMLATDSNKRSLWLQSANIAMNNNDPKSALTRMEIALKLGENDPSNQLVTAQLHLQHGSISRAVELMQASMSESIEHYGPVIEAISWLRFKGETEEAEQLINTGLEHWDNLSGPQESRLLGHRGGIALDRKDNIAANRHLSRAVELDPANGEALLSLADLESAEQLYVQASIHYSRAAAMDGFAERALLGHAQLALDQRDYQQAVALLSKASQANPERQDIKQNIQILERLIRNEP